MALNAGDMLYYDGTKWVNSSTVVAPGTTSAATFEVADSNPGHLATTLRCKHAPGGALANGSGTGIQYLVDATEIGDIDCKVGIASPMTTYFSITAASGGSLSEMFRVGSTGGAPAAYFGVRLVGLSVPFQLSRATVGLPTTSSFYSLLAGDYQSPIIEFTPVSGGATNIIFPATAGGFWIIYNNSGAMITLTNTPGGMGTGPTLATGKRAIFYSDGSNMQQVTPPQ